MLTLRPPIKLSTRNSMLRYHDDLSKKIEANYRVMASSLSPENMLHFMTDSAEIYMEGDSMTSMVSVNNRINRQQINVELVNNVLNRILLNESEKLTYQDRTFIDMVLKRIGITDVQQFMNQVALTKQNTANINKLLTIYNRSDRVIQNLQQYFKETKEKESLADDKAQTETKSYTQNLYQQILRRLDTAAIYEEIENFFKPVTDNHFSIDSKEFMISEQVLQAKNLSLNQVKNEISYRSEPLEYRALNTYELGDIEQYSNDHLQVTNEFVEAVVLNAINQAYALRQEQIDTHTDTWYDLTESIQQSVQNTMNRFEQFHQNVRATFSDTDVYNRTVQQNITNEITALEHLYEQHTQENNYVQESYEPQEFVHQEETHVHGQQINYLTNQEELLKQQLNEVHQINLKNEQKLEQVTKDMKPAPVLRINRAKAMTDAMRAMEEPEKVILEYMNQQNTLDYYESERQEKLSQVVDENVLKIFEQIERYHQNPANLPDNITVNDVALEHFIQDTTVREMPPEQVVKNQVEKQTRELVQKTRQEEIKQQIERVVRKETTERQIIGDVGSVELIHKTNETDVNEELLEEIRNVNRNVNRSVEEHDENIQESRDIYRTITNQVNHVEVADQKEIATMVAYNVQDQLGTLSEQVYRRLEKRLDTEKRRRGL